MNKPFVFKQFTIDQDRCAMKIGTDAVLLGAWTTIDHNPFSILDIGAGTGILSLMLAQRSGAEIIDAIEIDADTYEQCAENFENSSWNDRLFCYHVSLEAFTEEVDDTYDLIISNPPFYTSFFASGISSNGDKNVDAARATARFQDAMPFEQLTKSISKLLSKEGKFTLIIPFIEEDRFTELASNTGLFPNKILRMKGNPNSEIKRSLMEFSFNKDNIVIEELIIETERHQYTQDYIDLTKDFYLKM